MKYLRKYSDSLLEQQSISFEQRLIDFCESNKKMKYLRPFNESLSFKDELLDFCESNLAYLLDEAELQVIESPGGWHELHLIRILLDNPKRWNEIKDQMIPFLTRLVSKYEINNQPFKDASYSGYVTSHAFPGKKIKTKVEDIRLYISFDNNANREFTSDDRSYMTGQIKDLIADNIGSPNARISDIRFYVKGYKTEKKSFISKIKSFFK